MLQSHGSFADALCLAHTLSPVEKVRLIEQIAPDA